ncbi:hypothetical protein Tco_0413062 [Tanacetum coccineum]
MVVVSNVPKLIDKKGGSYSAVPPCLEPVKFNKWKKCMLYYLTGMEPYYIQCIKDGPFKPKITKGDDKPESQWTPKERRVDFQENSNDEADERSCDEYLRDLELEYHERALWQIHNKEVSDDEEETRVQVLMTLVDDELFVGKNHARNDEWIDITTKKINILLSMDEDSN